jgi:hypothetical protein
LSKRVSARAIGKVLQDAIYDSLCRCRDQEKTIWGFKMMDSDKLPDFLVCDIHNRMWQLEAKNLRKYDSKTRLAWVRSNIIEKKWRRAWGKILVISHYNFDDPATSLILRRFHTVLELGLQVDANNYLQAVDSLTENLGKIFGSESPEKYYLRGRKDKSTERWDTSFS